MGKDCGSWLHHQCSPWQMPNLNYPNPNALSVSNPYSANGSFPGFAFSELAHLNTAQGNQQNGWFYCETRRSHGHSQALTPSPNTLHKEKHSALANGRAGEAAPNTVSGSVQKRLLIFDQSGNEKNLIFSSVIGTSIQHLNLENPKPFYSSGSNEEELVTKRDGFYEAGQVISDGLDENQETNEGSEDMHEDTEEINALLYSDDDSDYDDEETSTGHSPSEITVFKKQEEVKANAAAPTKRKRLLYEEHGTSSLMDTATSLKPNGSRDYEDDAESSYMKDETHEREDNSLSSNKRLKKERIQETMRILQSIIPNGEHKDAVFVLEEAIGYLKSLKLKIKSLGLDLE